MTYVITLHDIFGMVCDVTQLQMAFLCAPLNFPDLVDILDTSVVENHLITAKLHN